MLFALSVLAMNDRNPYSSPESPKRNSSILNKRWSPEMRFFISAICGSLFTGVFLWASILGTGWWLNGDHQYSGQGSALYFYKVLGAIIIVVPISFFVSGTSVVISLKWRTVLLGFLVVLPAVAALLLRFNVQMSVEGWMNFISVVIPPIISCELPPIFFAKLDQH